MWKQEIRHQRNLIDASGLGLLPGIGLALAIALLAVAAVMSGSWWVVFAAAAVVIGVTALVAAVVHSIADDD